MHAVAEASIVPKNRVAKKPLCEISVNTAKRSRDRKDGYIEVLEPHSIKQSSHSESSCSIIADNAGFYFKCRSSKFPLYINLLFRNVALFCAVKLLLCYKGSSFHC